MSGEPSFLLVSRSGLQSGAEKMLAVLGCALVEVYKGGYVHCIYSAKGMEKILPVGKRNFTKKLDPPLKRVASNPWLIAIYFFYGFLFLFKMSKFSKKHLIVFNDLESLLVYWPAALLRKSYFYLHDSHRLEGLKGRLICYVISALVNRILVITRSRVKKLSSIGVLNTKYFPNCSYTEFGAFSEHERQNQNCLTRYKAVSVGQIAGWKRIEKSIAFIEYLNELGVSIDLEIYGRPDPFSPESIDYSLEIEKICKGSKVVCLCGYNDNLKSVYADADFFISMSINEPFGLAIVEALSYGVPVIAVEGEGPNEIVDSEVGLLLSEDFKHDADLISRVMDVVSISPDKCKARADLYSYDVYRERVRLEFKAEYSI